MSYFKIDGMTTVWKIFSFVYTNTQMSIYPYIYAMKKILTSNRMLADRYVLSALFCAWQWMVLLWSALFALSFKMDLAVDNRLSGDGSFIYSTPAVKTFPEPSIHVIYTFRYIFNVVMERPKRKRKKKRVHQTTEPQTIGKEKMQMYSNRNWEKENTHSYT